MGLAFKITMTRSHVEILSNSYQVHTLRLTGSNFDVRGQKRKLTVSDAGSRTRLYPEASQMKAGDASRYTTSDGEKLVVLALT
jgi:hypothetical protein